MGRRAHVDLHQVNLDCDRRGPAGRPAAADRAPCRRLGVSMAIDSKPGRRTWRGRLRHLTRTPIKALGNNTLSQATFVGVMGAETRMDTGFQPFRERGELVMNSRFCQWGLTLDLLLWRQVVAMYELLMHYSGAR